MQHFSLASFVMPLNAHEIDVQARDAFQSPSLKKRTKRTVVSDVDTTLNKIRFTRSAFAEMYEAARTGVCTARNIGQKYKQAERHNFLFFSFFFSRWKSWTFLRFAFIKFAFRLFPGR